MVRKRIARGLERYIESKTDDIVLLIARNVDAVRRALGDRLPDIIIGLLTRHFGEDDEEISLFSKIVVRMAEKLPDRFKDEVGDAVRQDVDKAVEGVTEFISSNVISDMQRAVTEFAEGGSHHKSRSVDSSAHQKSRSVDSSADTKREVTDRGISNFFRRKHDSSDDDDDDGDASKDSKVLENVDLSFLFHGREGLIQQILDLVRPTVHRAGEDIVHRMSSIFPGHVHEIVARDVDDEEMPQRKRDKLLQVFKHDLPKSTLLGNLFHRLPKKIERHVRPHIETFEQTLLQNLSVEFHEMFREGKSIREFFKKMKK